MDRRHFLKAGGAGLAMSAVGAESALRTGAAKAQNLFPKWRQALVEGKFTPIAGTAPATLGVDVQIFDAWSGLGVEPDRGRLYSLAGGGHAVSDDNGVYMLDLTSDAPKWTVLRKSSGLTPGTPPPTYYVQGVPHVGTVYGAEVEEAYWGDGRPVGSHNYYALHPVNDNGRRGMVRVLNQGAGFSGNARLRTDCFWFDVNDWDLNGAGWPPPLAGGSFSNTMCQDPRTQIIYGGGSGAPFSVFDPLARTWAKVSSTWEAAYCGSVVVPELDVVVIDIGSYLNTAAALGKTFLTWNIRTNAFKAVNLDWKTDSPSRFGGESALAYDSDLGRIYWVSAGRMMRIDPQTWATEYVANVGGVFHMQRLAYIPALRGLAFLATFGSNVMFMPTTNAAIPVPPHTPRAKIKAAGKEVFTLQEAVDVGGDIALTAGELFAGAVINKPVRIVAAGTIIHNGAVEEKGTFVVNADAVFEGLEIEGAEVGDGNGAAVRHQAGNVTLYRCKIHNCQDGVLGNNNPRLNAVVAECDVYDNGTPEDGQTHGLYFGQIARVSILNSRFWGTRIGHHAKSRAKVTVVDSCALGTNFDGTESYNLDLPQGGQVLVAKCTFTQGARTDNAVMLNYGTEANPYPDGALVVKGARFESRGVDGAIAIRNALRDVTAQIEDCEFIGCTPLQGNGVFVRCTLNGKPLPDGAGSGAVPRFTIPVPGGTKRSP